jgi:transcriptional regulator with XRE-family HTH domain
MAQDENIVKKVCKELGITQKELAEIMGVNDGTPAQWSSKGDIPKMATNFINVLIKNKRLKDDLNNVADALNILKNIKSDNL